MEALIKDDGYILNRLPKAHNLEDRYYREILKHQSDLRIKESRENKQIMDKTINYYSLWVHQIKTPIASIKLKIHNEDSDFSRDIKQDLNNIERYVNMVITYLRLNSESTDFCFRKHKMDDIIKPIIKNFSSDFIHKKLTLDYEPIKTQVTTDEKWISFAIEQILSNAIKYTKTGGISITMEDNVLIIKDTGIGISKEDLPRIFEKGFTGNNGRTDKQATGIGLYLCKRTCENLGHKLVIESELNQGTTVKILFQKNISLYS